MHDLATGTHGLTNLRQGPGKVLPRGAGAQGVAVGIHGPEKLGHQAEERISARRGEAPAGGVGAHALWPTLDGRTAADLVSFHSDHRRETTA